MRFIRALVTTEVDGGVTRIVGRCRRRSTLLFEALERCPCLDQGTVDGEVFLAQKPCTASLLDHASEETLGDVRLDKTLPGSSRMYSHRTPAPSCPCPGTSEREGCSRAARRRDARCAPSRRPSAASP